MDELKMYRPLTEGYTGVIETLEQDPFPLLNAACRTRMTLQSEAIGVEDHNIRVRTATDGGGFTFTNVSVPAWVIRLGGGYKGIIPITAAGLLRLPAVTPGEPQGTSNIVPAVAIEPVKPKRKRKTVLADHADEPNIAETIIVPDLELDVPSLPDDDDHKDNGESLFNDQIEDEPIVLSASAPAPAAEHVNGSTPVAHKSAWRIDAKTEALVEQRVLDVYLSLTRPEKMKVRRKMESMLGGLLVFRVLHIDQESLLVLLSRRLALQTMSDVTWSKLRVGQKVLATTKRVLARHAFCDIGGIAAILPASEIIDGHVADARTLLRENTTYEVLIKNFNKETGRVLLSMKALTSDPWQNAIRLYHKGSRHVAQITGFLSGGRVFVQLEPGVDLVAPRPLFSLSGGPKIALGDRVLIAIQELDTDKRRIHGKILMKK
ncbi:MAG: 30S ribosomal protein S1 [Syntrophomonadaceae bacterium]|nr:30S ribosomal protein S1 [Bacillota bacterium]